MRKGNREQGDYAEPSNSWLGIMSSTNSHGLSRHIPADVALEIRRRSKFGCVHCRSAIYQYEHIEPEFAYAISHDPANICLLCGACHDRVTRGRLSKATILTDYERVQQSGGIQRPFEEFDLSSQNLEVSFGSCIFRHSQSLISVNGESILSILPPQDGDSSPSISGVFYDSGGVECCRIDHNVWEGPLDCWDITVIGSRLTIKTKQSEVALELEISPPNGVRVIQLNMYKDNCHLATRGDELLIGQMHDLGSVYVGLSAFQCAGATEAISVDSRAAPSPRLLGLQMTGGGGIILNGTGIVVGKRAAQMLIGRIRLWTFD